MNANISRRAALGTGAALSASAAWAPLLSAASHERPNILWLVSEDNNPFIGAYGDKLAHTPTIDALARKGVLFRNAYSNAPVCAPSRFGILTGVFPESCAPAHHMRAEAILPEGFRTYPELLRQAGYFCTNNSKTDYNCQIDPNEIWDEQGKDAHWRKRPLGSPFMAVFNNDTTHEGSLWRPSNGKVTPDMIEVPPYLPDLPGIRSDYAAYYNSMEKMDSQIAEWLAQLEADGLADDTIVFYYSDNGGVLPRSKRYCYQEGLRCALMIYAPPKWQHLLPVPPGREVTYPVSFIDLAPTVLALAGVHKPPQMNGHPLLGKSVKPQRYAFGMRNRMDERIDFQRTVTDGHWRYIRNYLPHKPLGQYQAYAFQARGYQELHQAWLDGKLNATQARFFEPRPHEELYNLKADPHEVHNLAAEPAQMPKLAKLRRVLDRHMLTINDNGFIPESMKGEGYFESRNPEIYPLAEVMELAGLAAQADVSHLSTLAAALSHQVPVMRYWAATGLAILKSAAAPARAKLIEQMQGDEEPVVRIATAEALVWQGYGPAIDELGRQLVAATPWQTRLHAMEALSNLGAAARPVRAAIERATKGENVNLRNSARYLGQVLDGTYRPENSVFEMGRLPGSPPRQAS
jgi:arylsulfatase A-like enzyme